MFAAGWLSGDMPKIQMRWNATQLAVTDWWYHRPSYADRFRE